MEWLSRLLWTAVLSTAFCLASIIAGLFQAPSNIWIPLGLAGITFAVLNVRAEK